MSRSAGSITRTGEAAVARGEPVDTAGSMGELEGLWRRRPQNSNSSRIQLQLCELSHPGNTPILLTAHVMPGHPSKRDRYNKNVKDHHCMAFCMLFSVSG